MVSPTLFDSVDKGQVLKTCFCWWVCTGKSCWNVLQLDSVITANSS